MQVTSASQTVVTWHWQFHNPLLSGAAIGKTQPANENLAIDRRAKQLCGGVESSRTPNVGDFEADRIPCPAVTIAPTSSTPFDLTGRVALITGGNSGIGLGMAEALVGAGSAVAIWGTNPKKNDDAVAKLRSLGGHAEAYLCDVGEEAEVEAAFAATVQAFGRVDACFANSGVGGNAKSFIEMTSEEWHRVLRVNLDGVFYTLRAAARHMVERGEGGSMVVTASLAAIQGQARGQHYAATKGGVIAMMRACAIEFARHGISSNAILPGWVETPMTENAFAYDRFRDAVMPRMPFRRWGTPADFGPLAVYLASPSTRWHTGEVHLVDGGYSIF
jgi:NAD(P)-dependent dehydrogenase (short-subunit alcohol dehydrogenase family)